MQESKTQTSAPRGLTALQQHGLDHLRAAMQQNRSIAGYARDHQLNPNTLHRGRSVLKQRGV